MDARQFLIKIGGPKVSQHLVPLWLLANTFNGVQQAINYIALAEYGFDIKKRVTQQIKKDCELHRFLERPGSYEMIIQIPEPPQTSINNDIGMVACSKYLDLISNLSINSSNGVNLQKIIPNELHLRRILKSIEIISPKYGDDWYLYFEGLKSGRSGSLDYKVRNKIGIILSEQRLETRIVTGELIRLYLDQHRIAINYEPTQKVLECNYASELEDYIINNIRNMVQIKGNVELDTEGHPVKIINAFEINELDLSPFQLSSAGSLTLKTPIEIYPTFEGQEIIFEIPELNIIGADATREEAISQLQEDLIWLWHEYGNAPDKCLSGDAKDLKSYLKTLIKEEDPSNEENLP